MSATNFHTFKTSDEVARRAWRSASLQRTAACGSHSASAEDSGIGGASWILSPRGLQAQLARYFGVDRSTICRDMEALREEWRHTRVCRVCGVMWGCTLRAHANLYKWRKRRETGLEPSCCVRGYLAREAVRKKKRATPREKTFRAKVEQG